MSLSRIFHPLVENFLDRQNGGDTGLGSIFFGILSLLV